MLPKYPWFVQNVQLPTVEKPELLSSTMLTAETVPLMEKLNGLLLGSFVPNDTVPL